MRSVIPLELRDAQGRPHPMLPMTVREERDYYQKWAVGWFVTTVISVIINLVLLAHVAPALIEKVAP